MKYQVQIDGSILSHDPLPPVDSIDIYKRPATSTRSNRNNAGFLSLFLSYLSRDISRDVAEVLENTNLS